MAAFLIPILGIIVLGVTSYSKASDAIVSAYKEQTQQTADALQGYISLIINSEQESFKSYAADQQLGFYFKGSLDKMNSASTKTSYSDSIREKLNTDSKLSDIYFFGDGGRSITARTIGIADDAYATFEASEMGQKAASDEYSWHLFGIDDELDSKMGISQGTYALRWVRKLRGIPAAIIVDIAVDGIRESMNVLDAGDNGYVALVTLDGKEFYSDASITESGLIFGQDFYNTAVAAEPVSGNQMVEVNGTSYLFVYSKFDVYGDMVAALIPESDMLSQTAGIRTLTMTITVIAGILAFLLAFLISGNMSKTITYILNKLRKVAEGDFTTSLENKGKDELALLCEGVNDTVDKVKGLIVSVNDISAQVNDSAVNMANASNTFKSTSGDIQSAVALIEQGADKLDSSSDDCLSQMDTLSGRISEVGENAEEIGRLTGITREMIENGMKSVGGLTESAAATTKITAEVIVAINKLEERSKDIQSIVASINAIAKQTNLLSLNASIEAARAGEAGRGFSVVATQIRDLSAGCMDAANQITDIVDEISDKTAEVVDIAKQAEATVASQSSVVDLTKNSFVEIEAQVNALIGALDTITSNVSQIDESRVQTLNSIESISAVSEETVAYSSAVNDATNTQSQAISNLDEASTQLKRRAEDLVDMMKAFIIK